MGEMSFSGWRRGRQGIWIDDLMVMILAKVGGKFETTSL